MYSENEGANLHLFLLPVNFLHTKKNMRVHHGHAYFIYHINLLFLCFKGFFSVCFF